MCSERRKSGVIHGSCSGIMDDFFCCVFITGKESSNTASEGAVLVERYKDTGPFFQIWCKRGRRIHNGSVFQEVTYTFAGQLYTYIMDWFFFIFSVGKIKADSILLRASMTALSNSIPFSV